MVPLLLMGRWISSYILSSGIIFNATKEGSVNACLKISCRCWKCRCLNVPMFDPPTHSIMMYLYTNAWSRISPILTSLLSQRTQFSLNCISSIFIMYLFWIIFYWPLHFLQKKVNFGRRPPSLTIVDILAKINFSRVASRPCRHVSFLDIPILRDYWKQSVKKLKLFY